MNLHLLADGAGYRRQGEGRGKRELPTICLLSLAYDLQFVNCPDVLMGIYDFSTGIFLSMQLVFHILNHCSTRSSSLQLGNLKKGIKMFGVHYTRAPRQILLPRSTFIFTLALLRSAVKQFNTPRARLYSFYNGL
jgi:hypothetical protein